MCGLKIALTCSGACVYPSEVGGGGGFASGGRGGGGPDELDISVL